MRVQVPFVIALGLFLMPLAHAVQTDAEATFAFEIVPGDDHSGNRIADQFVLEATEHARDLNGVFEPRFAEFAISNIGPVPCAVTEVFIYDPNHIIVYAAKFGTAGAFSDFLPVTVPNSILNAFTPTDTYVAVPGSSTGISPGTYWGLDQDLGYGIVEALDTGSVKIGLLVERSDGQTHTYINVADAGSTFSLMGPAMLALGLLRRKWVRV